MRSDRRPVTRSFQIDTTAGFAVEERVAAPVAGVEPTAAPARDRVRRGRLPIEVAGRLVPRLEDIPVRRRRRDWGERDGSNFATGVRNAWVAFWWNLWSVGRWCVGAAVVLFFATRMWLGQPWGWVAAAVPMVVLVLWLGAVVKQGRRHTRGQAGPPPGWIGRF